MENLSDALRMAAGVLLAILLVTLIVYIFNTANTLEEEKSQQVLIEQTNEFNRKFLAYEKTSMYGTDVMSVISLAINNNRDLNGEITKHPDGEYHADLDGSVNIKVTLLDTNKVRTKTKVITIDNWLSPDDPNYKKEEIKDVRAYFSSKNLSLANINTVQQFQKMIIDESSPIIVSQKRLNNHTIQVTQKDIYGLEDFKSSIFKCSDIKYSQTGKIYEMTFDDISK